MLVFFVTLLPRETGAVTVSLFLGQAQAGHYRGVFVLSPAAASEGQYYFFVQGFYQLSPTDFQMTAAPIIGVFIAGLTRPS